MQKNVAGQKISFQLNLLNGDPATTGTPAVSVNKDGAGQAPGAGTMIHQGKGEWLYSPTQAETNAAHVAFSVDLDGVVNQVLNVYPSDLQAEVAKVIKSGEEATWTSSLGTKNDVVVTRN